MSKRPILWMLKEQSRGVSIHDNDLKKKKKHLTSPGPFNSGHCLNEN